MGNIQCCECEKPQSENSFVKEYQGRLPPSREIQLKIPLKQAHNEVQSSGSRQKNSSIAQSEKQIDEEDPLSQLIKEADEKTLKQTSKKIVGGERGEEDPLSQLIMESDEKALKQASKKFQVPKTPLIVTQTLKKQNFFQEELEALSQNHKKMQNDMYVGELDQKQRAHGFGKICKQDGSLFIGYFVEGKAHGAGVYIFNNGSYCKADFIGNKIQSTSGTYSSNHFRYTGGFKQNSFHGSGKEHGQRHEFEGEYNYGKKVKGKFKWFDQNGMYQYEGSFHQNGKFNGKGNLLTMIGTLKDSYGVYEGDFLNGQKHGYGQFQSISGLKYKGSYVNGVKSGKGTIYDKNDRIIYSGEMREGLPDGRGEGIEKGVMVKGIWEQGILITSSG